MLIKGVYRDIIRRCGREIADTGWSSNNISKDYGKFLAALMKKDFQKKAGIDYLIVGTGSAGQDQNERENNFKERATTFFTNANLDIKNLSRPLLFSPGNDNWIWANAIDPKNITYLVGNNLPQNISNSINVRIPFDEGVPSQDTLVFGEFALLGIDMVDNKFDINKMFFIDYVSHGKITKDKSTQLVRDIKLTFP